MGRLRQLQRRQRARYVACGFTMVLVCTVLLAYAARARAPQKPVVKPYRRPTPPLAPLTVKPTRQAFADAALQALVDAGAFINPEARRNKEDDAVSTTVYFNSRTLGPDQLAQIARISNNPRVEVRFEDCRLKPGALEEVGRDGPEVSVVFERCHLARSDLAGLDGAPRLKELIFLQDVSADDETFADIKSLPGLELLRVVGTEVGDAGLGFLAKAPRLRRLFADATRVGDETVERIESDRDIEALGLCTSRITDKALPIIGRFPKLKWLEVAACDISDAGISGLANVTSLMTLNLNNTKITDVGLARLAHMGTILTLNVSGTKITDDGLTHLGRTTIELLNLRDTETSDACLKYLATIRDLNTLDIGGTNITEATAAKALPNVSLLTE